MVMSSAALSNSVRTPVEAPSMDLVGLRVYAARTDDRVTGRVEFPHETNGRSSCPIDYHSRRPQSPTPNPQSATDDRAARRLQLVRRWQQLCRDNPGLSKTALAERLATAETDLKVSTSSLRVWARKLETEGPGGLRDRYVKPPRKILTIDAARATNAVKVCAWWAYRIGNAESIDTKLLHSAVALLEAGHAVADIIATIECYYSYSCDRARYPFLPFARWAKYHFEKWVLRACDENDYRRAQQAKARKREVLHRGTRRAIRDLSENPSGVAPVSNRCSGVAPVSNRCSSSQVAQALRFFGEPEAARREIAAGAPGLPALAANRDPQTIAESLGTLDDGYRRVLLEAAHGDRHARDQAIATLPLWWDALPQTVRHNIGFKVDAWQADHPRVTARQLAARKLDMLLPAIRNRQTGAHKLGAAARITA